MLSSSESKEIKITGTLINYYIHCKRQCWLFGNRINLEDNSELVKIGRALHEKKETQEIEIDNIKIDKISSEYLTEIKKSDADLEACKYQLLFYLNKLKKKGVIRKGKLEVVEKRKNTKKIHIFELNEKFEDELNSMEKEIKELICLKKIPKVPNTNKCKKCAYNCYCSI